jgi:thiamine-phosphate pyrophosphorylase
MGEALEAGVRFFQYRSKKSSRRAVYEIALQLAGAAHRAGALFIVNDHVDIAVAVDADGVHLGQEDLPLAEARTIIGREKLIGISTHGREQASAAEKAGADYIGYGPVFRTPTKDAGPLQGTGGIRSVRQALSIPVVAIGGIRYDNLCSVIDAGADSVAVISAVLSASDLKQAAGDMVRLISAGRAKYQGGI